MLKLSDLEAISKFQQQYLKGKENLVQRDLMQSKKPCINYIRYPSLWKKYTIGSINCRTSIKRILYKF